MTAYKTHYYAYITRTFMKINTDLSHTNKCTNYIIYCLKLVLITDIKTLSNFHSSYMFRHNTCHPQGALMFLAKITGKQFVKHEYILCEGCGSIS
jgi:hypothetical protein